MLTADTGLDMPDEAAPGSDPCSQRLHPGGKLPLPCTVLGSKIEFRACDNSAFMERAVHAVAAPRPLPLAGMLAVVMDVFMLMAMALPVVLVVMLVLMLAVMLMLMLVYRDSER